MPRCLIDQSIDRRHEGDFSFPLGVYPVEPLHAREGYVVMFEHADGEDEPGDDDAPTYLGRSYGDHADDDAPPPHDPGEAAQDWWPDRYVFDIQVSAQRLPVLVDMALSLMPGRIYPILDVIGEDAYREIDPYMSYELVGTERVIDGIREMRGYLFEDGMVGFGVISEDPFMYMFVDEHKLVTFQVEPDDHGRVVDMLAALGLEPLDDLPSVETVSHEHRSTLVATADDPQAFTYDEIVEFLRDQWRLRLNIDPSTNLDENGDDLGVTGWRCIARCQTQDPASARYAECLLRAECLDEAEELALDAVEAMEPPPPLGSNPSVPGRGGPGPEAGSPVPDARRPMSGARDGGKNRDSRSRDDASGHMWTDAAIISCDRLTPALMADAVRDALHPDSASGDATGNEALATNAELGPLARLNFDDLRGADARLTGVILTRWEEPLAPGDASS